MSGIWGAILGGLKQRMMGQVGGIGGVPQPPGAMGAGGNLGATQGGGLRAGMMDALGGGPSMGQQLRGRVAEGLGMQPGSLPYEISTRPTSSTSLPRASDAMVDHGLRVCLAEPDAGGIEDLRRGRPRFVYPLIGQLRQLGHPAPHI